MASGIEFFLTRCVRESADHPKGWQWFVLDEERLHHDILQVLLNHSPDFCLALFGHDGRCTRPSTLFDLVISKMHSSLQSCVEIKVDHSWSDDQCQRQMNFLRENPAASGKLILLSQQASWLTRDEIELRGEGRFQKISYKELYKALDQVSGPLELCELARGYKLGLEEQEQRTWTMFSQQDPNR